MEENKNNNENLKPIIDKKIKIIAAFLGIIFLLLSISSFFIKNDSENFDEYLKTLSSIELKNRGIEFDSQSQKFETIFTEYMQVYAREKYSQNIKNSIEEYWNKYQILKDKYKSGEALAEPEKTQTEIFASITKVYKEMQKGISHYHLENNFYSVIQFFLPPAI